MKKLIKTVIALAMIYCCSVGVFAQDVEIMEESVAIASLTEEDYALIQSQEVYYVGVRNLYSSICNRNSSGELEGLAIDVIDMIAEIGGIEIEYVELEGQEDYEEIDFYFLGPDEVTDYELVASEIYYEIPLMYVEKSLEETDEDCEVVGVITYYGITEDEVCEYINGKDIIEYSEMQSMKDAFNSNEIDSMIITTASLNMIRSDLKDLDFYSTPIGLNLELCYSFPSTLSTEKIDIFNAIIGDLDEATIEYALFTHSSLELDDATIGEIILNNPMMVVNAVAVFVVLIIILGHRKRVALAEKVNYDSLTGVYSLYKFTEELEKRLESNPNKSYTIVSIDVDNFKYINEIYGYEMGSYLLKQLASLIQKGTSKNVIIARSFADNFLLLAETEELEQRILFRMEEDAAFLEGLAQKLGKNYRFSFSIGIYEIADKNLDVNYMIDCSNIARRSGKKMLSTTINKYTQEMDRIRKTNNEMVSRMDEAIENREFVLYYQPKVELETGNIIEAEALVRWVSNGDFLQPNSFIPLFEKNGFIYRLDLYVVESVCAFISLNNYAKLPKISVNLSSLTIMRASIVNEIMEIIKMYRVKPAQIDLEITETAFVIGFDQASDNIKKLRTLGFTISMDDFGAGISSLNRLKNIDIDTIKIDRGFIVDSIENAKGMDIIKNVIRMAQDIKVGIVAEGIETEEQREILIGAGCSMGQGYLFAKPMPLDEFLEVVSDREIQLCK